ncbi:MAG: hypothetical protein AB8G23_05370 [Myxococcota bacterium]
MPANNDFLWLNVFLRATAAPPAAVPAPGVGSLVGFALDTISMGTRALMPRRG